MNQTRTIGARLREARRERSLTQEQLAGLAGISRDLIAKLEQGRRTSARVQTLEQLAAALDIDIADLLGDRGTGPDRRAVLAGSIAGMLAGWPGHAEPARITRAWQHPAAVDPDVVSSLAAMLAAQRQIEDRAGTTAVRNPVLAQLTMVEDLLRGARGRGRLALVQVAQQWAQFGAYLHRDAGDQAADRALLAQTLEWATEIGDATMTATVLMNRGEAALSAGDAGTALGLAQAIQHNPVVAVGQRARAAGLEACGLAMVGDTAAADRKLGEAAELAARLPAGSQEAHPWLYWISPLYLECNRGVAYSWLADDPRYARRAIDAMQAGYAGLPEDHQMSSWGGTYLAHLSVVYIRDGDTGQACSIAGQAAAIMHRTASVRLAAMLAHVHALLVSRWPGDPRVAEVGRTLRTQ